MSSSTTKKFHTFMAEPFGDKNIRDIPSIGDVLVFDENPSNLIIISCSNLAQRFSSIELILENEKKFKITF
ncbi:unnamed protein product [Rotaria sordida]|uniref:Uncharacterized protein n=1 Tax=Rotaria sordida TaxID=392033 RepID=A0A818ZNC5_9BILA|nr:unnamed protein product [Rotaria sordida]